MNNVILGGGVIGLLAAEMFPAAIIIPFGKSRYYYYDPCLEDNHIIWNDLSYDIVSRLFPDSIPMRFKSGINYCGEFLWYPIPMAKRSIINKLYDKGDEHPHAEKLFDNLEPLVHSISTKNLYNGLVRSHYERIEKDLKLYGQSVKSIDIHNKTIATSENKIVDYDNIISTIPVYALMKYMGDRSDLDAKNIFYTHVASMDIDMEGANLMWVSDSHIDFFKVIEIYQNNYVFQSFVPLNEEYIKLFGKDAKIINNTGIEGAFPMGPPPDLGELGDYGIYRVGTNAQWDYFMCVSSCMNRLVKLSIGE